MLIRLGYELAYEFPQATPMILNLNVHYSRASDWVRPDTIVTDPAVRLTMYRDGFGNWCTRLVARAGAFRVSSDGLIKDSGLAELSFPNAFEHTVDALPEEEREVVNLIWYEGMSQPEAAEVLGVSSRTVLRRWHAESVTRPAR